MVTILVIISIVLAVLAVVQLVRVFESTARLQGGVSPLPTDAENGYQAKMMIKKLNPNKVSNPAPCSEAASGRSLSPYFAYNQAKKLR